MSEVQLLVKALMMAIDGTDEWGNNVLLHYLLETCYTTDEGMNS